MAASTSNHICSPCPKEPLPYKLPTSYKNHQISAKMRLAQLLKQRGTFETKQFKTPNLPGTRRQVVQKANAYVTWRRHGDTGLWGF